MDLSHHAFKKSDLVIVSGNKYDHSLFKSAQYEFTGMAPGKTLV